MSPEAMLEERIRIITSEVKAGRVAKDRASIEAFVAEAFTLPADDRRSLVMIALKEIDGIPEPKKAPTMKPVDGVLRGKALIAAAAAILRERPDLPSAAVYDGLAKVHRIAMSKASFPAMATEARKLARGNQPIAAPAPTRTPEKATPRPRTQVARRPAAGSPPPVARPQPEPNGNGHFHDGDRILVEVGGEKLDARRSEGRWMVEFEGKVEDELVARLMGRMVAGVGA